MARPLRIQAAGLTYHVTARGTGRMTIFLDDTDRRRFLARLADVVASQALVCHAFCLMPNHYHLVLTTTRANLSAAVRLVNGNYAQAWNRRHERVGHVFQGRFDAQVVQRDAYFATVCRYVALNPVRARLVASPEDWPWSSYRATIGSGPRPRFLSPQALLAQFGGRDLQRGARRYRQFVTAKPAELVTKPSGRLVGDDSFVEQFRTWAASASREVPRSERELLPMLKVLFAGATTRESRAARVLEAWRRGHRQADIARILGVHYTTVSRMIRSGAVDAANQI